MQLNPAGLNLIKRWESLSLKAYKDGAGILTIGWGHTGNVKPYDTLTEAEADSLLMSDALHAQSFVDGHVASRSTISDAGAVIPPTTDNQFAAMVCLTFNIGVGAFKTSSVLRFHNQQKFLDAADSFLLWDKIHQDGVLIPSNGLLNRRREERALYVTP